MQPLVLAAEVPEGQAAPGGPRGRAGLPRAPRAGRARARPSEAAFAPPGARGAHAAGCRAAAVRRPPRPAASLASASPRKRGHAAAPARSAGPATWSAHHCRAATTSWCPHSVGVMQARAATMSATVSSPVWPMPVKTGLVAPATARATTSVSKAARSARAPPPRTMAITSQSLRLSTRHRPGDRRRRVGRPARRPAPRETRKPKPRPGQLAEEVPVALGPGTGHQARRAARTSGSGSAALRREQALGLERCAAAGPAGRPCARAARSRRPRRG